MVKSGAVRLMSCKGLSLAGRRTATTRRARTPQANTAAAHRSGPLRRVVVRPVSIGPSCLTLMSVSTAAPPSLSLREGKGWRGHPGRSHLQCDPGVRCQWNHARVALVQTAIDVGAQVMGGIGPRRGDARPAERLPPDSEELPEGERGPPGRLNVDQAIGRVSVQPEHA